MTNDDGISVSSIVAGWVGPQAKLLRSAASGLERDTVRLVTHVHNQCSLLSKYARRPIGVDTLELLVNDYNISQVRVPRDLILNMTRRTEMLQKMKDNAPSYAQLLAYTVPLTKLGERFETESLDVVEGMLSPSFPPARIKETIGSRIEPPDDFARGTSVIVNFSHARLLAYALYVILVDVAGHLLEIRDRRRKLRSYGMPYRLLSDHSQPGNAWQLLVDKRSIGSACRRLPYPLDLLR